MAANFLHRRGAVVTAIGFAQIVAFGSTFYLPAVLAQPIVADTGWPLAWVIAGLSLALLISGLVSMRIGRFIHHFGGRPVLASSAVLLAAGLSIMAVAQSLPVYLFAWVVMGLGMSGGLYDAAFSTLGRLYGENARSAITWVTLFGGFASTVCWPLSALLVETYGWRGACLAYAAIYLVLVLPAYLIFVPPTPRDRADAKAETITPEGMQNIAVVDRTKFVLLALILTVAAMISSMLAVHLLAVLQLRGVDLATAVAFGTIVGPSQVAGRFLELIAGRRYHPIWAMAASVALMALGLALLAGGLTLTALALLIYGAGNGIHTIARGALPLVLFDPKEYALVMGRLAMPSLIVQALAPSIGALLLDLGDDNAVLGVLLGAALCNVALTFALYRRQ